MLTYPVLIKQFECQALKADLMKIEEGRRYRYAVPENWGVRDEMKTLRKHFSLERSTDAFCKELGLDNW